MAKFIDLDTGLPALLNKVKAWVNSKTEDFITAEDAAGIVAATGDLVIVERDNYIDILITESQVDITPASLALYAAQKSAVIKVSGTHLKNDISISVPTGFTASPSTIAQVNGTVAQTDVTIAYTGADASTASGNITATAGDVVKSIPVAYSQYAGPTILADSTLTIKAAAGQSNTGSLQVTGLNLTAGITATVSGTGFTVSSSESGTYGSSASLPSSGGTLYVKFSPTGSTGSTGTLTLSSTGATSKTVDLTGAVSTLTASPSSLSLSTTANTPTTGEFTIHGSNLTNGVTLALTDTNSVFNLSKNSLTKAEAEAGETITVTYSPTAAGTHNASVAVSWDGGTENVSLGGTTAQGLPAGYTEIPYIQGHAKALMTAASFTSQWELDVVCDSTPSTTQILACSNSAGGHYAGALTNGKFGVGAGAGQYVSAGVTTRTTVVITFSANGISLTAGGETVTRTGDAHPGYVLILGSNDNPKYLFEGKCYGIRCLNEDLGTFILCKNSSNQQGVYNTKQGVFFNLDA